MNDLALKGSVVYGTTNAIANNVKKEKETPQEDSIFESKLTLGDKMKAFNTGFLDRIFDGIKETIDFAKKEPLLAATAGVGILALGATVSILGVAGGFILGGFGLIAGGIGIFNSAKEIKEDSENLKNAKSDKEMLDIIHELGGDSFDLTSNVALTAISAYEIKTAASGARIAGQIDDVLAQGEALRNNPATTASQLRKLDWDSGYLALAEAGNDSRLIKSGLATTALLSDKAGDKIEEFILK